MHVHFVGVSGTGMGSLAGLVRALGHDVSGSDVAFDPPIGPELERWGVRCMRGFSSENLATRPDLVVVGNVCRADNPEARAAIDGGLRVTTMAHALADLALEHASPLVVAGTHGKTTTTSIAAWLLHAAGLSPGFLVGGVPKNFGAGFAPAGPRRLSLAGRGSSQPSRGVPFVVEGDEYDTAFFEKTPKFWHYRPEVAIVTSIEHDHIDIYPTEASYLDAFRGFVRRVPETGLIVAAADSRAVVDIVRAEARAQIAWYALAGDDTGGVACEWLAAPGPVESGVQSFELFAGGSFAGRFALRTPGEHNVRNATAAIAAAAQGFAVPLDALRSGLAGFTGVRRRQDLVGEVAGVLVYDDFAHHPTAVDETLRALRAKHPAGRLVAVFEPRSATACRALHQAAYVEAFGAADAVVLAPLGRSTVPAAERLDVERLARDLTAKGREAEAAPSVEAIVTSLAARARAGDVVALLSNGAFGGIHAKLLAALGERAS